jgi:hypothetical protein
MNYNEKENLKRGLIEEARGVWETQQTGEALTVLKNLEEDLWREVFTEKELAVLRIRMNWVAFPVIPEKEQMKLIAEHLLLPLYDGGFDLKKPFEIKQLLTPISIWPDETVPKLIETFLQNQEKIGDQPRKTKTGKEVLPTIEFWLKDYLDEYGMDKQESVAIMHYLSQSENVNTLNNKEKEVLKRLLLLFESIKVFSIDQIFREVQKIAIKENQANAGARPSLPQPTKQPTTPFVFSQRSAPSLEKTETSGDLIAKRTIKQALESRPQIAAQEITSQPVLLLGKQDPVRPTVQNWLLDYRSRFGISEHTAEDQKSFIEKSPNTKNLSEQERQRVFLVIDSYDNDSLLNVSETNKRLLF